MSQSNNLAALEQSLVYFGDPAQREQYFELYDSNIVLHGYAGVGPGLASVKQFYASMWSAFPDARVTLEETIVAADKVICRFVLTGTHQGLFNGIPATGKAITLPGITILRFANGKCVERWSQADFLGLLIQLGAIPD